MVFSEFIADVKDKAFPEGEAENLISAHRGMIIDALIDLQRHVKCLQVKQTSVYPQCSTYFRSGRTVLDAPDGKIRRLYTLWGTDYNSRIQYARESWQMLERWSRQFCLRVTDPLNTGLPSLPLGFKYPEATTDSLFGRARGGMWHCNEHDNTIVVAPWLQSGENLVIEWSGIKKYWNDLDAISDLPNLIEAVVAFVGAKNALRYEDDPKKHAGLMAEYVQHRADMMFDCRQIVEKLEENETVPEDLDVAISNALDSIPSTAAAATFETTSPTHALVGVIGNYGTNNANELAISALVKARTLDALFTTGNNHVGAAPPNFDLAVGKYFSDYIYPFVGSPVYGTGASSNHFYPALGPSDYDADGGLKSFYDYFALPNNERYYDLVIGSTHFFIINSNLSEPSGTASNSTQAQWAQRRAALSTAKWKVAIFGDSPLTATRMAWGWKAMGFDLLLCRGDYAVTETADEVPLITSGATGALFLESDCGTLEAQFENVNGTTIDALELTK